MAIRIRENHLSGSQYRAIIACTLVEEKPTLSQKEAENTSENTPEPALHREK
ncbi:hypothetical protein [Candidatus Caldatribacterium saccharofermentans]|uniref:hypothetical protein n=1 Tax=Candidatus Caldatribacterium saccharofermentans TaxID=1454753 RepID=UPI0003770AE4